MMNVNMIFDFIFYFKKLNAVWINNFHKQTENFL